MTIHELFTERARENVQHPDIWEHMATLRDYASRVRHITEIGTRTGNSTTAFLAGLSSAGGTLHSWDRDKQQFFPPFITGVEWVFHEHGNTHEHACQPEPTELLFIDGDHSYQGVSLDLRFAGLVSRFIIMHDTALEWTTIGGRGVYDAKADFLARTREWVVREHFDNCNGLTVMERR